MFRRPAATNIKLQASGLGSAAAIEEKGPSYMAPPAAAALQAWRS